MNKLLFARIHGRLTAALWDGTRFLQLDAEEEEPSILGNIYIAKVKNVVKNINSAFVDLGRRPDGLLQPPGWAPATLPAIPAAACPRPETIL